MLADYLYKDRKLVMETEWTRVYSVGPKQTYYESKFVRDKLQVSARDIKSRWSTFNKSERIDFVNAFQSKHTLTTEDEDILEFLMENGEEYIWSTIALALTRMAAISKGKHEKILEFLLRRVEGGLGLRANYYQALAELKDPKAVPALKAASEEDRARISMEQPLESFEDFIPYVDYLQCCASLYCLTGAEEYKAAIETVAAHPDERVKARVRIVLRHAMPSCAK